MTEPPINQPGEPAGVQPVPSSTPRDGTLSTRAVATLCKRCGYVLAGLPINGDCPECGLAVRTSLMGNQLQHADPKWLGSVYRGQLWVALLTFLGGPIWGISLLDSTDIAIVIVAEALMLAKAWAWWILTTPEPDRPPEHEGISARKATRVLVILATAAGVLRIAFSLLGSPGQFTPVGLSQLLGNGLGGTLLIASLLLTATSFFTASRYLRQLALRSFDKELAGFILMGQIFIPAMLLFLTCVFGVGLFGAWAWWVATLTWSGATARWAYKTRLAADEAAASRRTLQ
jgi:hypothetical protein